MVFGVEEGEASCKDEQHLQLAPGTPTKLGPASRFAHALPLCPFTLITSKENPHILLKTLFCLPLES